MRYYVEAYDKNDIQILGNLDGQGAYEVEGDFRESDWYRALPYQRTLGNRVKYYRIVDENNREIDRIPNLTFTDGLSGHERLTRERETTRKVPGLQKKGALCP